MEKLYKILDGLKPMMMMVTVQIALAGVNILYKLVANAGMSLPVLIAYRFLFAAATIVPLALVLERLSHTIKLYKNHEVWSNSENQLIKIQIYLSIRIEQVILKNRKS